MQNHKARSRLILLAIFGIFFGGLLLAGILRFSGWQPAGMKNRGELLQPPGDLRAVTPYLLDGAAYHWNPAERIWRIAVLPPAACTNVCVKLSQDLDLVWKLFGHDADHVHILWVGALPANATRNSATKIVRDDPALRTVLSRTGAASNVERGAYVYIIDPNGFVIMRYGPGMDPSDLRSDMVRLLKLM